MNKPGSALRKIAGSYPDDQLHFDLAELSHEQLARLSSDFRHWTEDDETNYLGKNRCAELEEGALALQTSRVKLDELCTNRKAIEFDRVTEGTEVEGNKSCETLR